MINKKKIIVFDKFLGYNIGGAQKSLRTLLDSVQSFDLEFIYVGCKVKKGFSAGRFSAGGLEVNNFPIIECPRFPYFEYYLNRWIIRKNLKKYNGEILLTQGLWGASACFFHKGTSIYFIRDEYQLNRIPKYKQGLKKYLQFFYLLIQYPFIYRLFKDNKQAIKNSTFLITNSNYLKKEVKQKFNREAELIYSTIDFKKLTVNDFPDFSKRDYLVCIGNEFMKGRPLVEMLAKRMPEQKFMIVGRSFKYPSSHNNVYYEPWTKSIMDIYKKTKILLIPSLWNESLPRVAREAGFLGIPVIGTKNGGIPEAVDGECLIADSWNVDDWKNKIIDIIKNYSYYSVRAKEQSAIFNNQEQEDKFISLLNRCMLNQSKRI